MSSNVKLIEYLSISIIIFVAYECLYLVPPVVSSSLPSFLPSSLPSFFSPSLPSFLLSFFPPFLPLSLLSFLLPSSFFLGSLTFSSFLDKSFHCPTLPSPTLPYPTLPYPTLPYTTLPFPTSSPSVPLSPHTSCLCHSHSVAEVTMNDTRLSMNTFSIYVYDC